MMDDGFPTTIRFPGAGVVFFEKEITPPTADAGGPNDTTTMRNNRFRTKQPKQLVTLDKATLKVAYDPLAYTTVLAQIGVNQLIVVVFPDARAITFWGWLDKFAPDSIKEGEQPTAEITIECSNENNQGREVAPILN